MISFLSGKKQIYNMWKFGLTFIALLIVWILFTWPYNFQEFVAGFFVSFIIAYITKDFMFHEESAKALNPRRWAGFIVYFFLWVGMEIKSHLQVAWMALTGRINPAIIRIRMDLETDIGRALVGNSITLTPGTLTLRAGKGKDIYVHCIGFDKKSRPGRLFERFGRRVTE